MAKNWSFCHPSHLMSSCIIRFTLILSWVKIKFVYAILKNLSIGPITQAVLASVLFATSAPFAKLLLHEIEPVMLAALLYLGSGIGLLLFKTLARQVKLRDEAGLGKSDIPWLLGAVVFGGIAAPVVLMYSLKITPAATASLLLNFEGVATSIIAAIMFKEAMGRRIWIAIAAITVASIILTWDRSGAIGLSVGAVGVLAACVFWGLDNNLTRHISAKDPVAITILKGLIAGSFSLVLAFVLQNHLPGIKHIFMAAVLGFFAYGMSIVLFISSMRNLGAARTCAYFGTSPFIGAILSFVLFIELPNILFIIATSIMVLGVICMLNEKHEHTHTHEEAEHEHGHDHADEHHLHDHEMISDGFHCYLHKHCAITHRHPHTPDIHHRHQH